MAIPSASQPAPASSAIPSPSHRLPTVSATQALKNLQSNTPSPLKTGLPQLDTLLAGSGALDDPSASALRGIGLQRGTVTEIWGPSGSGKTTLATQIAAHALHGNNTVIWIDASSPVPAPRLHSLIRATAPSHQPPPPSPLNNFHHLPLPTLSHILTLLLHPPASLPLTSTSLLVLENIHVPLETSYPRTVPSHPGTSSSDAKWAANRRYAVIGSLISALRKLAVGHGIAVVVTSNAVTRGREKGEGAVLVGAVGGVEWERGVGARIVCFRDYRRGDHGVDLDGAGWRDGWYFGLTKVAGRMVGEGDGEVGVVVAVEIGDGGVRECAGGQRGTRVVSPVKVKVKRKIDEVEDSDDELGSEYGWDEGDEIAAEGLIDEDDLTIVDERRVIKDQDRQAGVP
ncbi:DNA repair protein rhp55 [Sphaceloma murrayae]|uniref:DNA repair protein rhp55 n=1 Tax=Sphaceloma murrayae TaxID=2082308 RepID=A0A2K1QIA9_9PEZI|nr:DNA repair protein rhp55 [Sphaceloma murrayae]